MSDLRAYLDLIKKTKELKVIKKPVSAKYEIAGITAKVDGSFAVLFENVKNSKFRVVSNLVGTRKRFAQALGGNENTIHKDVISAIRKAKKPKITSQRKFLENSSKDLLRRNLVLLSPHQLYMLKTLKLENKIPLFIGSCQLTNTTSLLGWLKGDIYIGVIQMQKIMVRI